MEFLIQLVCWVLFGYIGYKVAEKLNNEYNTSFTPGLWACVGVLFGFIGLLVLGVYAFFKIKNNNKGGNIK